MATSAGELTPRQWDVARAIASGEPDQVSWARLGITKSTYDMHRTKVFTKLGVDNRVQLARRLRDRAESGDESVFPYRWSMIEITIVVARTRSVVQIIDERSVVSASGALSEVVLTMRWEQWGADALLAPYRAAGGATVEGISHIATESQRHNLSLDQPLKMDRQTQVRLETDWNTNRDICGVLLQAAVPVDHATIRVRFEDPLPRRVNANRLPPGASRHPPPTSGNVLLANARGTFVDQIGSIRIGAAAGLIWHWADNPCRSLLVIT